MTLYEIDRAIMDCIDQETGEILDFVKLDQLTLDRESKIESVALAYKNAVSEAAALKAEKEAFAEREKRAKNRAESLKAYLDYALNGTPFKTTKVDVRYRKSEAVVVECDAASLPVEYQTVKAPEANKTAIKAALKAGQEIPWCHIETRANISIK